MQLLQRGFFTNILVAKLKKNQILLTGSLVEHIDMVVLPDVTNTLKKLVEIRGRLKEFENSNLKELLQL
ncbi:hypothetical protein Pelo_7633 [Pelomyxa schiedti]|nr:hypothetical protein Pelo_7633 [Pelomyxa schiedti]